MTFYQMMFLATVTVAILVRMLFIAGIHAQRSSPLEVDDSYAYLIHARALDSLTPLASGVYPNFDHLTGIEPGGNPSMNDWLGARYFQRFFRFYHIGHAYMLNLLHKITRLDYIGVWWLQVYLFNLFYMLVCAYLFDLMDPGLGKSVSMLFAGFLFLWDSSQVMAHPRVWAGAFFFAGIVCFEYSLRKHISLRHKKAAMAGCMLSQICGVTFHSLGQAWLLMTLLYVSGRIFLFPEMERREKVHFLTRNLPLLLALPVIVYLSLQGILDVRNDTSYPLLFDWKNGPANLHKTILFYIAACGLDPGNILHLFIILCCGAFVMYGLFKKKRFEFLILIGLISAATIGLSFLAIDYRPVKARYFHDEYSIILAGVMIALGAGLCYSTITEFLVSRGNLKKAKKLLEVLLLFLFAFVILRGKSYLIKHQAEGLILRHPYGSPIATIRAADRMVGDEGIVISSEALLYMYMTLADRHTRVAFLHPVTDGNSEQMKNFSRVPPETCKYILHMRKAGSDELFDFDPVFEEAGYVLGRYHGHRLQDPSLIMSHP